MNRIVLYALPLAIYATVLDVITPLQKKKGCSHHSLNDK